MATLEDIQDGLLERLHAGEAIDREAVLAEHPDLAADLQAFFALLDVIEGAPAGDGAEPTTLGEFRIVREIGRGGMGIVYEAEQPSLKRRVALKVLPPTLRMDPRLVSRFRREAEAAGRLRHPGIVPVFSVGEAAGAPFFAMELVQGTPLDEKIRARAEAPDAAWRRWAVATVAKVADALAYAHAEGILHRDVKPGNIIVDEDGAPRLTDFGLALDLHQPGLTLAGEVFGSPQYMSPEQAVRHEAPVDQRTDVYSLAVTLYELLTLRLPYDAHTSAELLTALSTGTLIPPRTADPDMDRALEGVLLRALRKDPRERYESASAFAADLRAVLAGAPPAARPPARWKRYAGAALLLLGVVWIATALRSGAPPGPAVPNEKPAGLAEVVRAGAQRPDASFWLAYARLRETPGELAKQIPDGKLRVELDVRYGRALQAAQRFCRDWSEWSDDRTRPALQQLEEELKDAGAAAAPYLLEVLGTNQYDAFSRTRPEQGVTARMQVRALHGLFFLDLKEAVPHAVLHCRGPSLTCTSTAALVLQKLTGENFDAQFLGNVDVTRIDWWAKNRAEKSVAFRLLVEQILAELRENVERGGPKRGSFVRDWWSEVGKLVVRDLAVLVNTHLPFEATTDKEKQLEQVARLEAWWKK